MTIPKTIHKGKNTYEFVKIVKDNMYLYKEKDLGFTTTFSNFDLGLVKETVPETKDLQKYVRSI